MLKIHRQLLITCFACLALLIVACSVRAQSFALNGAGLTLQRNEVLPPVPLRGYGPIAADNAQYVTASGSQVAVVSISCVDVNHARVMLAKYASDLHCLGADILDWAVEDHFWQSHSLYDMATMDQTDKPPVGPMANAWIELVPTPSVTQDLSGSWSPSGDGLTYATPIPVPGPTTANFLQRKFTPDPKGAGDNACLYIDSPGILMTVAGVIINGRFLAHNGLRGTEFLLNLTPWLRRNAPNTIIIVRSGYPLKTVELRYYASGAYPETPLRKLVGCRSA